MKIAANRIGYNILVIEDNPGDFTLVEELLSEQFEALNLMHANDFKEAKDILTLNVFKFDIILLDLSLPDKTGLDLIQGIIEMSKNTPVIVLTGYANAAFGMKSLALGVSDYIFKDELTAMSLYKSIVYSSEREKITLALKESERQYSELFQLSPQPMWVFDIESLYFLNVNDAAIDHYGYSREEFLLMTVRDIQPAYDNYSPEPALSFSKFDNQSVLTGLFNYRKKNGKIIQVEIQGNVIQYEDKKAKIILAIDVTERLKYIKAIEEQNKRLSEISWMQSHIVRAPLARLMGLVDLMKSPRENVEEEQKILEYILVSARELDYVIKEIVDKSVVTQRNPGGRTYVRSQV
jgi:PAS domain S-box-containing protein